MTTKRRSAQLWFVGVSEGESRLLYGPSVSVAIEISRYCWVLADWQVR